MFKEITIGGRNYRETPCNLTMNRCEACDLLAMCMTVPSSQILSIPLNAVWKEVKEDDEDYFTFSRREWKKIIYYYKLVVQPYNIKTIDPFYQGLGKIKDRTFLKNTAWIVLNTLAGSAKLKGYQREFIINVQRRM